MVKKIKMEDEIYRKDLIRRLQELYDDNSLNSKDEDTIIKVIEIFGGETTW